MKAAPCWTLATAFLLAACTSDRSAGGGGFEGETVAVAGSVTHGGSPLSGALVAWFDPTLERTLDSTRTGSDGAFVLRLEQSRPGWIEVLSGDSALERTMVSLPGSGALSLQTREPAIWTATLTRAGIPTPGARLRLWGSTTEIVSDAQGLVRLPRMPQRSEWVSLLLPDGTRRDVRLPDLAKGVLEVPPADSILLDDFETTGTQSALSTAIGEGWWFALTDSIVGGASRALPAGVATSFRPAYDNLDAWDRTSLSVGFDIDPTQAVRYGVVGVELSAKGLWIDLSSLDSLTFMAKGSGSFLLEFFTETGMFPTADPKGQFRATVVPKSGWTRVVVRKEQILAPDGSRAQLAGTSWSQASTRCRRLAFLAADTARLQLDDLVLHGPSLHELFPRP